MPLVFQQSAPGSPQLSPRSSCSFRSQSLRESSAMELVILEKQRRMQDTIPGWFLTALWTMHLGSSVGWSRDRVDDRSLRGGRFPRGSGCRLLVYVEMGSVMVTVYEFSKSSTGRLSQGFCGRAADRFSF
ncbi:hypothetical protein DPEC_G00134980 [Dallia pectoralis]|uniref:Uncharacterized protein n=1 Tax=Dallia pectoralis TaxID=75939 RepID=A0ACC2GSM0_DALPE|nr:hypothetical protein DPEC_G00134980 [Dallia pectoralis]